MNTYEILLYLAVIGFAAYMAFRRPKTETEVRVSAVGKIMKFVFLITTLLVVAVLVLFVGTPIVPDELIAMLGAIAGIAAILLYYLVSLVLGNEVYVPFRGMTRLSDLRFPSLPGGNQGMTRADQIRMARGQQPQIARPAKAVSQPKPVQQVQPAPETPTTDEVVSAVLQKLQIPSTEEIVSKVTAAVRGSMSPQGSGQITVDPKDAVNTMHWLLQEREREFRDALDRITQKAQESAQPAQQQPTGPSHSSTWRRIGTIVLVIAILGLAIWLGPRLLRGSAQTQTLPPAVTAPMDVLPNVDAAAAPTEQEQPANVEQAFLYPGYESAGSQAFYDWLFAEIANRYGVQIEPVGEPATCVVSIPEVAEAMAIANGNPGNPDVQKAFNLSSEQVAACSGGQ
jgi:hypothetical protein